MIVYTFLSVCLYVNRYSNCLPSVPVLSPLFSRCCFFKVDPVYFLIQILSKCLCYVYMCSQFNLSSKSLQTCFFVQGLFLSGLNRFILGFYQTSITMPGHDHSIVPKLKPGDLGTRDAFFLWNCPIQDEGLSIRQHVIE